MDELAKKLGAGIRNARVRRGLTQVQLAERINVGQALLSHMERGLSAGSVPTLVAIANELDVRVDDLLGRTADRSAGPVMDRLLAATAKCSKKDLAIVADMAEKLCQQRHHAKPSAHKRSPRR